MTGRLIAKALHLPARSPALRDKGGTAPLIVFRIVPEHAAESTLMLQKAARNRLGGDTGKGLWGNLLSARHHVSQTLLDFTLGEFLYNPFHVNKTRMTSRWKCSRRVCLMQL